MFIAALFTIFETWKQPKCPSTDEWIKRDVVHICNTIDYYLSIKKNEIMPFAETSIHLKIIILSEVSQKEKDKYHKIYQLYVEPKIWHKWTYLCKRNRDTGLENRLVVSKGTGIGEPQRRRWLSRWKPSYREWIDHKVLLHITGNCIQHPMISHNGKKHKNVSIYIYIYVHIYIYICVYTGGLPW